MLIQSINKKMNFLCKDEFDWLVNMSKEGNCFRTFKDISSFTDNVLLELRYLTKKIWLFIL